MSETNRVLGAGAPVAAALAAQVSILLFEIVLLVLVAVNVVVLYYELSLGIYPTMIDPFSGAGVNVYNDQAAAVLGYAVATVAVFFLVASVPVAIWVYRAHATLRTAGVGELSYSPGWAVASFFVPGINLVVPLRAMRELHNRSHGEDEWQAHSPVAAVTSWWSCLIAAVGLLVVAGLVAAITVIPSLYVVQPPGVNTGLFLFALVLLFGSGVFLVRIVAEVTKAQRLGLHRAQDPALPA